MEKSEVGKGSDGFIDRSKVRILLCDSDEKSSEEVFTLLCRCSYQVTSVKSPRQVIDALNAEGPNIDIILSEVDLPMSKGLKMLKYIMRDKELRRVPVIMMSAQDEVPIVVKCLKFGAADYLVKPLRTNELLNLWTHMWRRRRLLGLVEKNVVSYEFDMVVSDHSEGNTNSATLFSDDTDDRSRKSINHDTCVSIQQEIQIDIEAAAHMAAAAVEASSKCLPDVPGISDRRTGQVSSFVPKKSEWKIGESSAFFTYVKSITPKSDTPGSSMHESTQNGENAITNTSFSKQVPEMGQTCEKHSPSSNSIPESFSMERSCTPPFSLDMSQQGNSREFSQGRSHIRNDCPNEVSGFMHTAYHHYIPGLMNQIMMPPSSSMYHSNPPDVQNYHANPALIPQYAHVPPQCSPHMPPYAAAYYPFGICIPPGQLPMQQPSWPQQPPSENPTPPCEGPPVKKVDRREVALMKFRQKRKERCFDKKIRYVNRKKLAERRPRLRGQFVRKVNGVDVDVNGGQLCSVEDEEEEEDESDDEDQDDSSSFCQDQP